MVLLLIEKQYPLDMVIFFDTGMEFDAIYRNRDKLLPILSEKGITYVELHPSTPFLYKMLEKPVKGRTNADHCGYGWCGGTARWGTTEKNVVISRFLDSLSENYSEYVGIAYDEPERVKDKLYPLVEWEMTEADCLRFCREREWNWQEDGVDLYDILDRVSCWCCANKNRKELFNMFLCLPRYWKMLKELQHQITRPMKKWSNKQYGHYGNVLEMERVFIKLRSEWLHKLLDNTN